MRMGYIRLWRSLVYMGASIYARRRTTREAIETSAVIDIRYILNPNTFHAS
jgi:hypothetical protein